MVCDLWRLYIFGQLRRRPAGALSAGKHPSTSPAGLARVSPLHSWRHARGVHESAGRGFALTQHAHIVIIAVLYTRTTVALALPQAPSHTNVPHLSKGPPQPVPALRALPQGCRIPILGRSVITYFRYADTYAGRPRLSSLVSRRVRMPTALSALVSNVPYNHPNHTISNPTPDSCSQITSSGPPRILLTPISGLAPAGAAPANTPPRQLMPSAAWPHARLSLGAAAWRASRAWLTLQAGSGTPGALEEEEVHQVPSVLTVVIAHHTLRPVSPTRPSPSSPLPDCTCGETGRREIGRAHV